jgi:ABC-type microcin C transport system duplicated ATPase subunit YejF
MACGKPMLIITRNQTPLHNFLKDIDVAFLITESNHQVKCKQAINSIDLALSDKNKLKLMGDSGTGLILEKYSKKAVTGKYVDLIRLLLN